MNKINVMVVDDSSLIRSVMGKIINAQPDMHVSCTATDPLVAFELLKSFPVDVITLDIEMPRMDGISFLEKLMRETPKPVVMVSSLTERSADITFKALELGAVDFVTKPKMDIGDVLLQYADEISQKIRAAYSARIRIQSSSFISQNVQSFSENNHVDRPVVAKSDPELFVGQLPLPEILVFMGSSTGGTEALRVILQELPKDFPPILITQHMPAGFTKTFAERLNQNCQITVLEASHGQRIMVGHAYIAPGNRHLKISKQGGNWVCVLSDDEPVNRHKPSVEVLFHSAAQQNIKHTVAVMLTGMGKDGAQAMLELKKFGAHNICQDESSCVVFGMPREAIAIGAASEILPLNKIASQLIEKTGRNKTRINGQQMI